jgi:glycosyltransferase involved in cell wall biosynthesis
VDFGKYGWKDQLRYFALAKLIWLRKGNTDRWVVQTNYVKQVFCSFFGVSKTLVDVFPFYNAPVNDHEKDSTVVRTKRFVYASSGAIHKNHLTLFDAWEILLSKHQLCPELVVTVESSRKNLIRIMDKLNASGVNITNLGQLSNEAILKVLKSSSYVIFPSYLETLGLGMVEGATNGCVVLCGDFPFVKDILKNPIQFNAFSAESIAETVANTLRVAPSQPTIVNLEDMTTQFVKYLTDY